jgi:hypothetical protein
MKSPNHLAKRARARQTKLLKIVYRSVEELKPDPANPRVHGKKQVGQIAASIKTFGFTTPLLIDRDNQVIAGHGRLLACRKLGITKVPTVQLHHLTPAQARALMIADNQLTINASWDDRLLAQQLQDLSLLGLEFNIEVLGFEMAEIDLRISSLNDLPEPADDPADALPELSTGPRVSKLGDLWCLGPHRVLCGDAGDHDVAVGLMGGEHAAMAFTDPPYNVPIDGHASGLGAIRHRPFPMASGEMDAAEFTAFLAQALPKPRGLQHRGIVALHLHDWRHLDEVLAAGREAYGELKNVCVWVKDNAGMGSLYRSQHELVLVFKQGRGSYRNNVQLGQFGRNRRANSFARCGEEGNLLALHPTVKTSGNGRRCDRRLHGTR